MGVISKAAPDIQVQAHTTLGHSLSNIKGQQGAAGAEYAKVRALWTDPAGAVKKIAEAYPGEDEGAKQRRLGKALNAVGEAIFFAAEEKRKADVETIKFPAYKGAGTKDDVLKHVQTKVKAWLEKKRPAIEKVEADYKKIVELQPEPPPKWVIAAGSRVGLMWGGFVDEFRAAPIPEAWKKDGSIRNTYFSNLDQASEPIKVQRAKPALVTCLSYSVKYQYFDGFWRDCEVWLAKNYKSEYRVVDEIRSAPTLSNSIDDRSPPLNLGGQLFHGRDENAKPTERIREFRREGPEARRWETGRRQTRRCSPAEAQGRRQGRRSSREKEVSRGVRTMTHNALPNRLLTALASLLIAAGCGGGGGEGKGPDSPAGKGGPSTAGRAVAPAAQDKFDAALEAFVAHDKANDWTDPVCAEVASKFQAAASEQKGGKFPKPSSTKVCRSSAAATRRTRARSSRKRSAKIRSSTTLARSSRSTSTRPTRTKTRPSRRFSRRSSTRSSRTSRRSSTWPCSRCSATRRRRAKAAKTTWTARSATCNERSPSMTRTCRPSTTRALLLSASEEARRRRQGLRQGLRGRSIATNAALGKRADVQQLELAALVCSRRPSARTPDTRRSTTPRASSKTSSVRSTELCRRSPTPLS